MVRARRTVLLTSSLTLALVLTGCTGTDADPAGPGPGDAAATTSTLPERPPATGDPAVDVVLDRLAGAADAGIPLTATYALRRNLGPVDAEATLVIGSDGTRSLTVAGLGVGPVRFETDADGTERTCWRPGGDGETCEPGVIDARISEVMLPAAFWGISPARALRVAWDRRGGGPAPSTVTVGGVEASCVEIPYCNGADVFCATAAGVLARLATGAHTIELTAFTPG
jgi:hypothetical protein